MFRATLRSSLLAGFLTLLACPAFPAAENVLARQKLELPSGEILIGTLVSEDATTYVFRSDLLGEVKVPKTGTRLTPMAQASAEITEQAPGWTKTDSPPPAKPAAPAPVVSGNEATAAPSGKWTRSFEAGYSYQSRGSLVSATSTYLRGEVTYDFPHGTIGIHGRYLYGSQNSVRNTDKFDGGLKVRVDYADRIIGRSDFNYGYDRLKQLSNEFEEIAGLNFVIFRKPHFRYSLGPGVAVQYSEPELGQNGYRTLGDFSHELNWQISDRISFTNVSGYLYKPSNWADYRLRSNSALTGKLSEKLSVNLRYEYEFEALRPVADGRSDHRVFTTLGYTF